MIGSTFSSGTDVEVNFDKEDLRDAWFPAIVIKENEDNTFLVKYQNKEAKQCKDTVDFLHIRPPPPRYADRNYQLLEKVDALCDFAWRAGVIIKVLAERIYVVTFKPGVRDKRLNHSEIRPFVEWKDGKWKSGSKVQYFFCVSCSFPIWMEAEKVGVLLCHFYFLLDSH